MTKGAGRPSRVALTLSLILLAALPVAAAAANQPDLSGTWKIEDPAPSFKPEAGPIPFTADARKRYEQNIASKKAGNVEAYDHTNGRCASPGIPRLLLTGDRFRIWKRPGLYWFQYEWNRLYRQVDMGTLPEPQLRVTDIPGVTFESDQEALVGRAVPIGKGRWDGDALVITSENFIDSTLVDDLVPHGFGMKVTERLRLIDANTLEDRVTIEDPETFTKPWTAVVRYRRQADAPFAEDVCLERLEKGEPTWDRDK